MNTPQEDEALIEQAKDLLFEHRSKLADIMGKYAMSEPRVESYKKSAFENEIRILSQTDGVKLAQFIKARDEQREREIRLDEAATIHRKGIDMLMKEITEPMGSLLDYIQSKYGKDVIFNHSPKSDLVRPKPTPEGIFRPSREEGFDE